MNKTKPKSNKAKTWRFLLLAILPGLIVAGLVWFANIYYDLEEKVHVPI